MGRANLEARQGPGGFGGGHGHPTNWPGFSTFFGGGGGGFPTAFSGRPSTTTATVVTTASAPASGAGGGAKTTLKTITTRVSASSPPAASGAAPAGHHGTTTSSTGTRPGRTKADTAASSSPTALPQSASPTSAHAHAQSTASTSLSSGSIAGIAVAAVIAVAALVLLAWFLGRRHGKRRDRAAAGKRGGGAEIRGREIYEADSRGVGVGVGVVSPGGTTLVGEELDANRQIFEKQGADLKEIDGDEKKRISVKNGTHELE